MYAACFASFQSVSTALEGYIQSSYELSSTDPKKAPTLYKTLKDEKSSTLASLLNALKEPLSKKEIKLNLAKVKSKRAREIYTSFYVYLWALHGYLNNEAGFNSKSLKQSAKSLDTKLKGYILSLKDESYDGFLLKTRALFLKDVLNRLQKDISRSNAYYLNSINFQQCLNWINQKIGSHFLNFGKVIICLLVVLSFYVIMKLLTKLSSLIIIKYFRLFKKNQTIHENHFQEAFLHKLQRPIQTFIMVYSLGLCAAIIYYPTSIDLSIFRLFNLCYIWVIVWFIINVLDSYGLMLVSKLAIKSGQKEIINLVIKILYSLISIIAFLISLRIFGFNISTIIASLGIGGLAVALASKDIISNFFASVMLLFDDSFEQGDWVRIGDVEGNIVETGLRKTSIRGFDNTLAFIPNSTIMGASIINYSRRKLGRKVSFSVGLTYDATPTQIKKLSKEILALLKSSPCVAQTKDKEGRAWSSKYRQSLVNLDDLEGYSSSIFVGLASFGESSINIDVSFYTKQVDGTGHRLDKENILLSIMDLVASNGLSMAFPTRSIYIEKMPK